MEDQSKKLEEIQSKWRKRLHISIQWMVLWCFLMEVMIFVIRRGMHRFEPDETFREIVRSIVIPTLANLLIALFINIKCDSDFSEYRKNAMFAFGIMGMAAVVVISHGSLYYTYCVFALPIVASVMFADKKLTRKTLIYGIISQYAAIFLCWLMDDFRLDTHMLVGTLNAVFLGVTYSVCKQTVGLLFQNNEIMKDIDESNTSLSHALSIDAMTSLYNHNEFRQMLDDSHFICRKNGCTMTLVVIDIDDFKQINDTYGHQQGDEVLITVAEKLRKCSKEKGEVFRYGGEEFSAIFMDRSAEQALEIMEGFRKDICGNKFSFLPEGKSVTVSIGIFEYNGEAEMTAHDIFDGADLAMYEAKNAGKNKCIIRW